MDRTQHPVQDIEMIHIYSTWDKQGEVDYVEEARKRHEPEVRQVSREAMKELFEGMVINIFLSNKEANRTKALTDSEVYQRIKDEYGWDQASAVKDEILNISGIAKDGVDELRDKRELLTKGIKGLPDVKPQSLKMKFISKTIKAINPISEIISVKNTIDGAEDAINNLDAAQKKYEACMRDYENFKNKHFGDMTRCIEIQKNMILRFQSDIFKAADLEILDPEHIKNIQKSIYK